MAFSRPSIYPFALILLAAFLAHFLRPTYKVANSRPDFSLEKIIPSQFGDWKESAREAVLVADPGQKENLARIYTQTLSRSYESADGYTVMLSIAYGADQRDAMQVHKPEVCYPAQGFTLESKAMGILSTPVGQIPVVRIVTRMGGRHEPLMYWVTIGEKVVQGNIQKKVAEIEYGMKGQIPDGIIFRVSSIDRDTDRAVVALDKFSRQLLAELPVDIRKIIAGL